MSKKERERKVVMELYQSGHITLINASERLGMSYRQAKRIWRRYQNEGDLGLVHQSRGRRSNRRLSDEYCHLVLAYYQQHLCGFEPTFASEKLALANLPIAVETLRRLLVREGLWQPKIRKAKYRTKRQRRASFGELVQLDGSFHDWFDDGRKHCLMNMVDDSSSTTLAQLHDEETTEAAMRVLWAWIEKYGIPQALYTDKRNVYITDREPTIEEQLAGVVPLTAFGKCCERLGIEIITAHSPQAKGRVERSNGTYQDRFIKELKFQNIKTVSAANRLLNNTFCDDLNQRFALTNLPDIHRQLDEAIQLYDVFVWQVQRTLANDWTIRFNNQFYQLEKSPHSKLKPKAKITVQTHIDGKITLLFKGQLLRYQIIEQKPTPQPKPKANLTPAQKSEMSRRAAKKSPWSNNNTLFF